MSGWNDINFLNNANIKKMGHYCLNHDNFLNYSNIYRFLKYLIKPRLKKQDSNYDEEIIEKNTGFYLQNIKEIIKEAQGQGMLVSMVNLPSLYEENSPLEQQKLLPQFNSTSMKKMRYVRKAGLKINSLKKQVVNEFPEIEFINNGISFDSRGKALFFADSIHPNSAGNRIIAFEIFKAIINILNLEEESDIPVDKPPFSGDPLEIEYLKSLFLSNEIEDLSSSACKIFYYK